MAFYNFKTEQKQPRRGEEGGRERGTGEVPFPYRCSCSRPARRDRGSRRPVREQSQQVDDVREEDEADDGEKHQHQNVHHDGGAAGPEETDGDDAGRSGAAARCTGWQDRQRSGAFGAATKRRRLLPLPVVALPNRKWWMQALARLFIYL